MKKQLSSILLFILFSSNLCAQTWNRIPNTAVKHLKSSIKKDSSVNDVMVFDYLKKGNDIIGVKTDFAKYFLQILRIEPKVFDYLFKITPALGNFQDYHLPCFDSTMKTSKQRQMVIAEISKKLTKKKEIYRLWNFNCNKLGTRSCSVNIEFKKGLQGSSYFGIENTCAQ